MGYLHLAGAASTAQRNGLTVITPLADPGVSIAGNNLSPPTDSDTLKAMCTVSSAVANVLESEIQNTADPTLYRAYSVADQTTVRAESVVRINKTCRNPDGSLAQILFYVNNNNQNQTEGIYAWFGGAGDAFPTTKKPKLPNNARVVTATAAITATAAGAWTTGAITLNSFNPIPGQKYACYGMALQSATGMAFRWVPASGMSPSNKYPGAPASDTKGLLETWYLEDGQPWFIWDGINVPNVSVSCVAADTAQAIQLIIGEV